MHKKHVKTPDFIKRSVGRCPAWLLKGIALALLTALPVAFTLAHLYTVVTGVADTMHYFTAARDILNASSRAEGFQAVFRWAPGWPLIIAAFIRWSSPVYIYFLTPLLTWGTLFFLGLSVWMLTRRFGSGLIAALAAACFLLFRHPHSAYFMIYPFREPLSFLGVSIAWAAVIAGCRTQGARRYLLLCLSGLASVLAAGVREPAIFSLAGVAGYVLLSKETGSTKSRLAATAAVLAPLITAVMFIAGLFLVTGYIGSAQFSGWRIMTEARTWGEWQGMVLQYVYLLRDMLGMTGAGLLVTGIAAALWKHRAAAFLLLVPALVTLAFYSTFTVFPRYALSTALYLAPLLGAGLAVAVAAAGRLLQRVAPSVPAFLSPVVVLLLLALAARQSAGLTPWGRTLLHQFREVESVLNRFVSPSRDLVLIDYRYRHLHDLLESHLGIRPGGAERLSPVKGQARAFFIEPLSDEGQIRANVPAPVVHMREEILQHHDIVPVRDAGGQPVVFTLADASYAIRAIQPWSLLRTETPVYRQDVSGGLVWFDFRESATAVERRMVWRSAGGELLRSGTLPAGNGLIACAAGSLFDGRDTVRVVIESGALMPADPVVRAVPGITGAVFGFGAGRRLSVMSWVDDPVHRSGEKWGAVFVEEARFRIPNPEGAGNSTLSVSFDYRIRFPIAGTGLFRYADDSGALAGETVSLDGSEIRHTVRIPASRRKGAVLPIHLTAELPQPFDNHFRLVSIGLCLE